MIALAGALAGLAMAAVGKGLDALTHRERPRECADRFERFAIGCAGGLGIWSAAYGAFLLAGLTSPVWLLVKDGLLILGGIGLSLASTKTAGRHAAVTSTASPHRRWTRSMVTSGLVLAGLVVLAFNLTYMLKYLPDGGWDAWAIWNLRARFLFLAHGDISLATVQDLWWSHPDYPLLLPGLIANCWTLIGTELPSVGAVVSLVFSTLCVSILSAAVAAVRGPRWGAMAALMLAGTPSFLEMGRRQMADIPLAAFSLAAVVLARRAADSNRAHGLWVGAGVMMSLAAWTKNEGLMHLLALGVAALACGAPGAGIRGRASALRAYVGGACPGFLLLFSFKLVIDSGNDLVSAFAIRNALTHVMDLDRWEKLIAVAAEILFADVSEWAGLTIVVPVVIAANLATIMVRPPVRIVGLYVGVWLAGFILVYLCTPRDMVWHLRTSAARVFMQCWPACILLALLVLPDGDVPALSEAAPDADP